MRIRTFRVFVAPGFTVRHVVKAILEQGWPDAIPYYEDQMSLRKRKGWRKVYWQIGAETIKRAKP